MCRLRVHEEAGADPQCLELRYQWRNSVAVPVQVETVVGGELVVSVRHQRCLCGADLAHQRHKAGVIADTRAVALARPGHRVALDVEFHAEHGSQVVAILHPDMSLVGTRVHRDAIGPGVDTELRVQRYVGVAGIARVANQRNFVQVDAECSHSLPAR